jgi:tetratricopeptide (TPR) repeat protein
MFCKQCGYELSEGEKYCPKCGTKVSNPENEEHGQVMNKDPNKEIYSHFQTKSVNKRVIAILGALIIAILFSGFYYFGKIKPYNNFLRDANMAVNAENYDKAITLYNEAKKYKNDNSIETKIVLSKILKESKENYENAKDDMKNNNYLSAINTFDKVNKQDTKRYEDAQNKIRECKKLYNGQKTNEEQTEYKCYTNERYGFSIKYPSFLIIGESPTNGDGITMHSSDSSVELTVFGSNNVFNETAALSYNKLIKENSNITYKTQQGNWYVVSGIEGDKIFYEKYVVGDGSINAFIIKYPSSKAKEYNSTINELNSSFETHGIETYH